MLVAAARRTKCSPSDLCVGVITERLAFGRTGLIHPDESTICLANATYCIDRLVSRLLPSNVLLLAPVVLVNRAKPHLSCVRLPWSV